MLFWISHSFSGVLHRCQKILQIFWWILKVSHNTVSHANYFACWKNRASFFFFSRLMPTEFCFPPSFLMEKLFNPCVIRGTCLLTTAKESYLPTNFRKEIQEGIHSYQKLQDCGACLFFTDFNMWLAIMTASGYLRLLRKLILFWFLRFVLQ